MSRPAAPAYFIVLSAIALLSVSKLAPFAPAADTEAAAVPVAARTADAAGNWIDVPYVAQPKDGCGAAAISMVVQYWAKQPLESSASSAQSAAFAQPDAAADLQKIQSQLFVPEEKGIPATSMIGYFEQNGFRTYAFRGDWSDLEHHIEQGRPLIVSLKASGRHGPLHYAVVAGIDAQRNYIFLNDPARGKLQRVSREAFLGEWNPANNWTLLAVPAARD